MRADRLGAPPQFGLATRSRAAAVLITLALGLTGCSWQGPLASGPATWDYDRTTPLPAVQRPSGTTLDGLPLGSALVQRRSSRDFAPTELTAEQSAALLWAAQGQTAEWGGRTAPSAGALYALETYLVTSDSITHYVPDGHLAQVRDSPGARDAVAEAVGQDSAARAPALLVITGDAARLRPKYLDRAERYTLLEAGHAAQNVLLAAPALGLGGVPIAALNEAAVADALDLPRGEEPIYVIPIGTPTTP